MNERLGKWNSHRHKPRTWTATKADLDDPRAPPSFRSYVLGRLPKDVECPDAVAQYESHMDHLDQKAAQESIEQIQRTGIFFDLYHPAAITWRYDLRLTCTQSAAKKFVEDLLSSRLDGLSLHVRDSEKVLPGSSAEHLQPPHFAMDPNVWCVEFVAVPPEMSVMDVIGAARKQAGFESATAPPPTKGRVVRTVLSRFSSQAAAEKAAGVLVGVQVPNGFLCPQVAPQLSLPIVVIPAVCSEIHRIRADVGLSSRVIKKLDTLMSIPTELSAKIFSYYVEPEKQLDIQVTYLRRVHHFCFYSARYCEDEWELLRECGAVAVRGSRDVSHQDVDESEWVRLRDIRLEDFIATVERARPIQPSLEDESLQSEIHHVAFAHTRKVSEKYQCCRCLKLFLTEAFVQKHLKKAHAAVFDGVLRDSLMQSARTAYLSDKNRPMSLEEPNHD